MKKIKFFELFTFVAFLFASCSDVGNTSSGEKSAYVLRGSLSLGAADGALPHAFVTQNDSSRTATSSFADELTWIITATKDGKTYSPEFTSASSFVFFLEETGLYKIQAVAKKGDTVFASSESQPVTVSSGGSSVSIYASPVASKVLGNVELEINFDSEAASKISSVQVEWLELEDLTYATEVALGRPSGEGTDNEKEEELSEEVEEALSALKEWQIRCSNGEFNKKNIPVKEGKAALSLEGIFYGAHGVRFCFNDELGNTLYSCKEIINVYSGFTTDTWYGNAPYFKKDEASGETRFEITDDLITMYDAEVVPDTQTVLYKYDNETQWSYSLENSASFLNNLYNQADFCFDADGNVYLGTNQDVMKFYYYDGSSTSNISVMDSNSEDMDITSSGFLDYDFAKKQLWFVAGGTFYKFSPLSSVDDGYGETGYKTTATLYNYRTTDLDIDENPLAACVYNNIAYLVYKKPDLDAAPYLLLQYDISSAVVDEEVPTQFSIEEPNATKELCEGMELSSNDTISDMLYQDGAVYMLLNDSATYEGLTYSRGAVIKYDTFSKTVTTGGWTDGIKTRKVKTGARIGQDGYQLYEKCGNESDLSTGVPLVFDYAAAGDGYDYNFYAPYDNVDSVFAGPQKFVAIKPKKLVVADSGIAFYTDNEGVLKYKDVNRVVYVDLESLSITESRDIKDVKFCSSFPVPGSTNFYSNDTNIDVTSYYRWNTSKFIALSGSSDARLYGCFIKGE